MTDAEHASNASDLQEWNGVKFPAVVEPSAHDDLARLFADQRGDIERTLDATGAVLFRGFSLSTAEDFDRAVGAWGETNFSYDRSLSNAVRVNVTPRVFTANEAPPETSIYLHHEMAQTPLYPSRLFFFCETAPVSGGATPLCRSDIVLQRLEEEAPEIVDFFRRKGVRYSNTLPAENDASSGQGRGWKSMLGVDDKAGAEARLVALGYDWRWLPGDVLRVTSPILPAVRDLADGRAVFFNQLIAAYRGWRDGRNDPTKSITFGDGAPVEPEHMSAAIRIADELTFDLNWRAGDVALIDNFLVMHGRRPFAGKRRVLASLIA
ncbi:MAG: TauD/TfdA family dioxygenase [Pseudomonadota bacterium]